jgi:hypothetical protein
MAANRLGLSLLLALATFSLPALAERIGWVKVKNPKATAVAVEYRIGPYLDCHKNNDYVGSRVIAAGDTWTLEVRGEGNACIRVAGAPKWWRNKVNNGQTHEWIIGD